MGVVLITQICDIIMHMRTKILAFSVSALAFTACLNVNGITTHAEERAKATSGGSYYRETQAGNYLAGLYAQRTQDWSKASEFLNRLVVLDPENDNLHQRAMILAMGSGKNQQAFELARDILDQEPENLWALLIVSLESLVNKDFKNAQSLLNSMPEDSIKAYVVPILMTWIKASQGELDATVPDDNSVHMLHIVLAADFLGKGKAISPLLEEKIREAALDPRDAERIADIYARAGRKEKALEFYRVLESDRPGDVVLSEKIKRVSEDKSFDDLITYKQFQSPSEGIARAFFDLARIFYREYNDESAQIFSQMSLALDPNQTEAKILLAHIQTRYGRYEDAIHYYDTVNENDPNYLSIQHQAAELLMDLDRPDQAIALLNSLADKHDDIEALILMGDLYRREENFAMAIKTYDRLFKNLGKTVPDQYWSVYYARGMAYEQMGKWPEAEADLRMALDFQPDHPYLLNYLGYSLADRGKDLNEALNMIARAVDLRPADGYITDSLGWVFYRLGEYEKSIEPLERAVELLPYDPTINDHLGDAYWQVGRKNEAKFQWRRALNHAEDDTTIADIEEKLQFGLTTREAKGQTGDGESIFEFNSLNR